MSKDRFNYRIINMAALMILIYLGIANIKFIWGILIKIISLLSPFVIGFAFAYAFTPLVRWLKKKNIPPVAAYLIVIFGLLLLTIGILWITIPLLYDQLSVLLKSILEVFNNFDTKFNWNIGSFEIEITELLNDAIKRLGAFTSSSTMDLLGSFIGFLGQFIVGFVGFIYFLVDMEKIRFGFKKLLLSINKRSFRYVQCMDNEISNYLKGLEIFMVIQLFEYCILFLIIGHPNWLILGILACVTTIIPYFGGLITNIIAIILASVVSLPLTIATIIICLIFPQVDGYIISPKVYGKTNNVNPLITIMAVSVGGTLKGIVGIVIALPCYLLIRTTYHFFQKDLQKGMKMVKKTI